MIGFVGLGDQGEPIAARIAGSFTLTVWARRAASTETLVAAGASTVPSKRELGAACDHIGVCVRTDDDVRAVVVGSADDPGLLAGMRPGSVLAIHSTVAPATVIELAERAAQQEITLLDAPVSGGRRGATAGALTVLVGGPDAAVERARPVFETFASTIAHLGEVGAGQVMKLVNNNLCFANAAIGIAGLRLAEQLGLDTEQFTRVIRTSSGGSKGFDIVSDDAMLIKATGPTSNVAKDVNHLVELLAERGIDGGAVTGLSRTALTDISEYARHRGVASDAL